MTIALPTLFCTLELEHVFASGDVVDDGKKKQVEACQATFFKKWANPGSFYLFSFFSQTNFTGKTVGFSRIRTWIVGEEGVHHADHLTTTRAQAI